MESRSPDEAWRIEGVACHRVGPMTALDPKACFCLRRPNVRYSTLQTLLRRRYRKIRRAGAGLRLPFVPLLRRLAR